MFNSKQITPIINEFATGTVVLSQRDKQVLITSVNELFLKEFHLLKADLEGKKVEELLNKLNISQSLAEFNACFQRSFLEKKRRSLEIKSEIEPSNSISFEFIPIEDEHNAIQYVFVKIKSIHQAVQSEDTLLPSLFFEVIHFFPYPIFVYDAESLQFLEVNEAGCSCYGYSKKEFLKLQILDLHPAENYDATKEKVTNKARFEERRIYKDLLHKKKNGELLYVDLESNYIEINSRKLRISIVNDVTETLHFKKEVALVKEKLTKSEEFANIAFWEYQLDHNVMVWSPTLYALFEMDEKQLITSRDFLNVFSNSDRERLDFNYMRLYETRFSFHQTHQIISAKGTKKFIKQHITLKRDDEGNLIQLEGIIIDLTEKVKVENELRNSKERYQVALESTQDVIWDWDIEKNTITRNKSLEKIFGYPANFLNNKFGDVWLSLIHPEDREKLAAKIHSCLQVDAECSFVVEYRFLKADNTYAQVIDRGTILRNEEKKAIRIIGSMIDVTKENEILTEIKNQHAILREIAWTQSHVLRAPLAKMMSLLTLIRKKGITVDRQGKCLYDQIYTSAEDIDKIIREIVKKATFTEKKEEWN